MKKENAIQLKAAFLLIVFSLNTVIGFACAVGLDIGFNHKHHHEKDETTLQKTSHHHDKTYHYNEADNNYKLKGGKDNCCNSQVIKFTLLDKAVPQALNAVNPIFLIAFFSSYYSIDILYTSYLGKSTKYFVRSHHPPITNIRIAIQSFQI